MYTCLPYTFSGRCCWCIPCLCVPICFIGEKCLIPVFWWFAVIVSFLFRSHWYTCCLLLAVAVVLIIVVVLVVVGVVFVVLLLHSRGISCLIYYSSRLSIPLALVLISAIQTYISRISTYKCERELANTINSFSTPVMLSYSFYVWVLCVTIKKCSNRLSIVSSLLNAITISFPLYSLLFPYSVMFCSSLSCAQLISLTIAPLSLSGSHGYGHRTEGFLSVRASSDDSVGFRLPSEWVLSMCCVQVSVRSGILVSRDWTSVGSWVSFFPQLPLPLFVFLLPHHHRSTSIIIYQQIPAFLIVVIWNIVSEMSDSDGRRWRTSHSIIISTAATTTIIIMNTRRIINMWWNIQVRLWCICVLVIMVNNKYYYCYCVFFFFFSWLQFCALFFLVYVLINFVWDWLPHHQSTSNLSTYLLPI